MCQQTISDKYPSGIGLSHTVRCPGCETAISDVCFGTDVLAAGRRATRARLKNQANATSDGPDRSSSTTYGALLLRTTVLLTILRVSCCLVLGALALTGGYSKLMGGYVNRLGGNSITRNTACLRTELFRFYSLVNLYRMQNQHLNTQDDSRFPTVFMAQQRYKAQYALPSTLFLRRIPCTVSS